MSTSKILIHCQFMTHSTHVCFNNSIALKYRLEPKWTGAHCWQCNEVDKSWSIDCEPYSSRTLITFCVCVFFAGSDLKCLHCRLLRPSEIYNRTSRLKRKGHSVVCYYYKTMCGREGLRSSLSSRCVGSNASMAEIPLHCDIQHPGGPP